MLERQITISLCPKYVVNRNASIWKYTCIRLNVLGRIKSAGSEEILGLGWAEHLIVNIKSQNQLEIYLL